MQKDWVLPVEEESTSGPAINGWLQRISAGGVHFGSTICNTPKRQYNARTNRLFQL